MNKKIFFLAAGLLAAVVATAAFLKPADRHRQYTDYFRTANDALRKKGTGRPVIIIDMDRLDHNISQMKEHFNKTGIAFRLVTKSLPSVELINYIMKNAGISRIMAFHGPFIPVYMDRLEREPDILLGKPLPADAVREVYAGLGKNDTARYSKAIQWLADTDLRLREYLKIAADLNTRLRINIEIDVGLRRGGAVTAEELDSMLSLISANPDRLVFAGFMGYDGHLLHVPEYLFFTTKEKAVMKEYGLVRERYAEFIAYGKKNYPALFKEGLTFNGGGSMTYALYKEDSPVNDIAAGSGTLKPAAFDYFTLEEHRPSLFIAAPVLKKMDYFSVPFVESFESVFRWWDPNFARSYYIYGGGWAAETVSPGGISYNPLTSSPANENLLPNQSLMNSAAGLELGVGDFVFFRPMQSDAMFQFDSVLLMRSGVIIGRWEVLKKGF